MPWGRTTFGKTRKADQPYAVYASPYGWKWKVLKTYKHSSAERDDPYARWFVAATSPHMHDGSYEMGDTYARDVTSNGALIDADPAWMDEYGAPGAPIID